MVSFGDVVIWINLTVGIPLTILFMYLVFRLEPKDQATKIYYGNVLVANIIFFGSLIGFLVNGGNLQATFIVFYMGLTASMYFRTFVALERTYIIIYPMQEWIRQMRGSVVVSVLVWIFCIIMVPSALLTGKVICIFVFAFFPAPVFIMCLAGTLKAVRTASTVSVEGKRRIVAILTLLLIVYILMIFPFFLDRILFETGVFTGIAEIALRLLLISPWMDFNLYVFMWNESVDKALVSMTCCGMDSTDPGTSTPPA
ncbi:uncharacterized protein KZ484_011498 isoform 1-T1 [Pholidichthys leucotaenia]